MTLAPVIGLLQAGEQRVADRFMYVPLIGLSVAVSWGLPALAERWRGIARVLPAAAAALVIVWAVAARAQAAHWSDSVALWQHATRVTPDSYIAFENLGQALRERGELDAAATNYQQALALAPAGSPAYQAVIHNSLGLVLTRQGRNEAAVEPLRGGGAAQSPVRGGAEQSGQRARGFGSVQRGGRSLPGRGPARSRTSPRRSSGSAARS